MGIKALQEEGYMCICWSYWNTFLVHAAEVRKHQRLQEWVDSWYCSECGMPGATPFYSNKMGVFCNVCMDRFSETWNQTAVDPASEQWRQFQASRRPLCENQSEQLQFRR